jgi:hypothetical protein
MLEGISCQSAAYRAFHAAAVLGRDRCLRFRVVSVLLGLLLLTAVVLKTHQLATEPVLGTGLLESRWFLALAIQYELLLGFWLMSGLSTRGAWYAALATFAAFAMVAAWKVVAGDASCGCLGRVETAPWLALSIDISAIVALWFAARPLPRVQHAPSPADLQHTYGKWRDGSLVAGSRSEYAWLVGVWLTIAANFAFFAFRGAPSDMLPAIGQRIGELIVVEPERMLGQPFALGRYIDIGDRLLEGRWLVALYRAGCPDCASLLADWPEGTYERTAIICVPSGPRTATRTLEFVCWGTLSADIEWFVPIPLVIVVANNRVIDAWV